VQKIAERNIADLVLVAASYFPVHPPDPHGFDG
jgi:hypothetical protein